MQTLPALKFARKLLSKEEELWNKEYETLQVLPSSTRRRASKALLAFAEILDLREKRVLDAGCGNGRNAVYAASRGCEVHAVDFCRNALSRAQQLAGREGVRDKIEWVQSSLLKPLPFSDRSFDVTLDIYTSCHFLEEEEFSTFWEEMHRVTKVGGQMLCVLFPPYDEYYRRFLSETSQRVVVDPANQIAKKLYTKQELLSFFSKIAKSELLIELQFDDLVLGENYQRDIYALSLRRC
ncbi:MAG: class I SAM-dependent methyltransferase [Nitrososphaerales archaeon]